MAARIAKQHQWTPRFGEIDRTNPRSAENLLKQAQEEGCERIAIVGGDGTMNRVLNVLGKRRALDKVQLAVIPAGTCNDFARFLGLRPKRPEEAFRLACTGRVQPVDLGLMDNQLFLNNAGFGKRPSTLSKKMGPWKILRSFKPVALRASWDKGSIEGAFYMALVCNAPYFSGGLHFSRNVKLNDGLLDIYLVPSMKKWRLVPLLLRGKLGRSVKTRRTICLRASRFTIEALSDLWPQADGESTVKGVRQVRFSVSPEKAMIILPDKFKNSIP